MELGEQTRGESDAIIEYVDTLSPTTPLLPSDPFAAAKVRELCAYMELYVELVGRELYGQAYFGGSTSDATKERVRKQLVRGLARDRAGGTGRSTGSLDEALGMFTVVPTVGTITPTGAVVPVPERTRHHGTQSRDGGAA